MKSRILTEILLRIITSAVRFDLSPVKVCVEKSKTGFSLQVIFEKFLLKSIPE
jgi:hypothetical protein